MNEYDRGYYDALKWVYVKDKILTLYKNNSLDQL